MRQLVHAALRDRGRFPRADGAPSPRPGRGRILSSRPNPTTLQERLGGHSRRASDWTLRDAVDLVDSSDQRRADRPRRRGTGPPWCSPASGLPGAGRAGGGSSPRKSGCVGSGSSKYPRARKLFCAGLPTAEKSRLVVDRFVAACSSGTGGAWPGGADAVVTWMRGPLPRSPRRAPCAPWAHASARSTTSWPRSRRRKRTGWGSPASRRRSCSCERALASHPQLREAPALRWPKLRAPRSPACCGKLRIGSDRRAARSSIGMPWPVLSCGPSVDPLAAAAGAQVDEAAVVAAVPSRPGWARPSCACS